MQALRMLHKLLTSNQSSEPGPDGTKSATPGVCNCGFKHWFDGKEVDFVFGIQTSGGTLGLGYNDGDNPYTLAQEFISKHRLNENSLNDTTYISAIANSIIGMSSIKYI